MEARAKLFVQRFGIVANHIEPAAFIGTFRSESTDDYVTTRPNGMGDVADISNALLDGSKKMEHRAIVPHIVSASFELCNGDIGDEPMDLFCGEPKSLPGHVNSSLRNI